MKSRKIANFEITPPKKSAFQIPTPPDVPKQHSLTIFSARRGGGKSVSQGTLIGYCLCVPVWLAGHGAGVVSLSFEFVLACARL